MASHNLLRNFVRTPTFLGISVVGGIFLAYTIAGVTSVGLAKIALFLTWGVFIAEVLYSKWIKRLKRYRPAMVLFLVCCSGVVLVRIGLDIAGRKVQEQVSFATQPFVLPSEPGNQGHSNIELVFVGRDRLQFLYYANSSESANEPKRFFGLWDINRPFYFPQIADVPQALPLPWKTEMDFVFRGTKQGPMDVLDVPAAANQVKSGDHLFGMAYATCLNCEKERAYWIYFVVGRGGWYREMSSLPWGKSIQIPKSDATESQIEAIIDKQVPQQHRIPILER